MTTMTDSFKTELEKMGLNADLIKTLEDNGILTEDDVRHLTEEDYRQMKFTIGDKNRLRKKWPTAATAPQPVPAFPAKVELVTPDNPTTMAITKLIAAICEGNRDEEYLDALEERTGNIPFIVMKGETWEKDQTITAWEHNKDNARPDRHWGAARQRLLTVAEARAKTSPAHPLNPNQKLAPSDPWLTERTQEQRELVAFMAYQHKLAENDDDTAFERVAQTPLSRKFAEAKSDWDHTQKNDPGTAAAIKARLVYKANRRPFDRTGVAETPVMFINVPASIPHLNGSQLGDLQDALLDAFPTGDSLAQMVRRKLNENLDAIAGGNNLGDIVFKLLQWAGSQGRMQELITRAYETKPNNPMLREFIDQLGQQKITVHELHTAAVSAGLAFSRDTLFGGMDHFKNRIESVNSPAGQLLTDLHALEAATYDPSLMQRWLKNAVQLTRGRPEAKIFQTALQQRS